MHKKANEFKLFLKLENGIPKYDTYLRAIHNASDTEIAISRKKWLDSLTIPKVTSEDEKFVYQGKEISINAQDGKTIIGSSCISQGIRSSHIITNINTETGEILGEIEVDKKTNEIKRNLELIENIPSLNGVLTTFDAIGCQKNLGNAINGKGGLFLFQVKKIKSFCVMILYLHLKISIQNLILNLNLIERFWKLVKNELGSAYFSDFTAFCKNIDLLCSSTHTDLKAEMETLIGEKVQLFDGMILKSPKSSEQTGKAA